MAPFHVPNTDTAGTKKIPNDSCAGLINEAKNIVAVDCPSYAQLTIGTALDVVVAQKKATARRYRADILKGPFSSSKAASAALRLCYSNVP